MTVEIQTLTHFGHGKKERVARNISIDMEQVKFLPLLIICVQTAKGFIWNSSTTSISVCVGNTISLDWVYTLESGEILQDTSWTISDGANGSVTLATVFGSFSPEPGYVGRITHIGTGWIDISNATSSDIGTYTVIVALTSGRKYRMNATVHVHEIANASCKPTCDSSWKCQIPQACPVQNYIAAVWTVDGVKHINVFECTPNNYNKPYNVCAEGDAVTSCYTGPSLCREEKPCIGTPCQSVLLFALISLYIQCVIIIIVVVIFKCTEVSSVQTYVGSVAHFNFMLTEDSNEVLIKNKSGSVVMIARGKKGRSGNPVYRGRVKFTGNTNQKLISFILRNVTLSDAGIYIAVHSDANRIIGCQALIVKGKIPEQVPLKRIGPTCEDKPPEPHGKIPEQVPLKQIGPTCEDKPPEPHGPTCEDKPPEPDGCKRPYILGLVLGLGLGITFIVGCIIIASLISTGTTPCTNELGLGLGLGSGIPCVITIFIVVIIMLCSFSLFEGIPNIYKFGEGILDGFVIGIIVKRLKCKKHEQVRLEPTEVSSIQTHVGSEANFNFMLTEDSNKSEVHIKNKSGGVVMIARGKECSSDDPVYKGRVNFTGNTDQKLISFILRNVTLSDAGIYIADIAVHSDANRMIGCQMLIVKDTKGKTKNPGSSSAVSREQVQVQLEIKGFKDDEEERPPAVHTGTQNKVDPSKQTKDRQQPVPPANTGFEDNPTFRPLPPPPQKGEIKDRNVRGISATIGDTQDLASETPRPNKLPPIPLKQETVQEENVSEEPKKKRKKKKKMNVETPEEENGETDMRVI